MNDNNESRKTVADIVAMLRKQSDEERALATRLRRTDDDVDFALASCYAEDAKYLSQIADRIEAAWKRDEERAVEHATRHAEAVARDNCRDCVHNPRGKNYEGGNAAAMRDIVTALANVVLPPRGKADEDGWLAWVRAMQAKARAALADATTEKSSAVGNAAAMREALELCVKEMCNYCRNEAIALELELTCVDGCEAYKIAQAALSKPPRNCDRFADETDAQLAFLDEVWLISVDRETMLERDKYENWTDEMRKRYGRWLLAPAAERKGE